jgi:hypothetical protein
MSQRVLAASLIAAVQLAGASAGSAADLYPPYGSSKDDRYHEDQRHGDIYKHPPPGPYYAEPRDYEPPTYRPGRPFPRDYNGYLEPFPRPPRFAEYHPPREGHCVPRHEIKRELYREGWSDFHDIEIRGEVALLRARRPDGRLFDLKIDRCSGEIVHARPAYGDPIYAGPRRDYHRAY